MKYIKYTIIFILLFGGMLLTAASAEGFWIPGMVIGLAMLGIGAMLSNIWKDLVR